MTRHSKISFLKSGIRFLGYGFLIRAAFVSGILNLAIAGVILIASEIIGVWEEFGTNY